MAVPAVAAAASQTRKYGPGSRGSLAGKRKATDVLGDRTPDVGKRIRERQGGEEAAAPAKEQPASDGGESTRDAAGSEKPAGGFFAGVRQGAREGVSLPARGSSSSAAADGSGVVLGFLVWVWVVVPYLKGGFPQVRRVLSAKFTNSVDGKALP